MSYNPVMFAWVIGFVTATILAFSIGIYQNYRKHIQEQRRRTRESENRTAREQMEIEKWKRRVLRP
ncbi:MAG TPA: hypothetical protein VI033_03215 [Candidatus Nitrosopolaris sp.]